MLPPKSVPVVGKPSTPADPWAVPAGLVVASGGKRYPWTQANRYSPLAQKRPPRQLQGPSSPRHAAADTGISASAGGAATLSLADWPNVVVSHSSTAHTAVNIRFIMAGSPINRLVLPP